MNISNLALNFDRFEQYNFENFAAEDILFFELMVFRANFYKWREFSQSEREILRAVGVRRTKLESIRKKFIELGFITCGQRLETRGNHRSYVTTYIVDRDVIRANHRLLYK